MEFSCECGKKKVPKYQKNYLFKEEPTPAKSFKPIIPYVPNKITWNPPSIYQRSYLPVKSTTVIVGAPPSKWRRPAEPMDGETCYQSDFSYRKYIPPKWYHHPHIIPSKKREAKISEYVDRYRLLSRKEFEKATKPQMVVAKICAKRPAGFARDAIKPPMFTDSMYLGDFKHPDQQLSHFDRSGCAL